MPGSAGRAGHRGVAAGPPAGYLHPTGSFLLLWTRSTCRAGRVSQAHPVPAAVPGGLAHFCLLSVLGLCWFVTSPEALDGQHPMLKQWPLGWWHFCNTRGFWWFGRDHEEFVAAGPAGPTVLPVPFPKLNEREKLQRIRLKLNFSIWRKVYEQEQSRISSRMHFTNSSQQS